MENNTYSKDIKLRKGWSWGAMMWGWIWGIGNHTYWPLLGLIPILNCFWWIVCGIKGHDWAYQSNHFNSVEEFNAVQDSWDTAGKVFFFVLLAFTFIYIGAIYLGIAAMI